MSDADPIRDLIAIALDTHTLLVSGGIYVFLRALRRFPLISKHWIYRRLLPILPESIGVAISISRQLPVSADNSVIMRIALGLWCGYLAQKFHKILGQTLLGDDADAHRKPASEDNEQ